MADNGNNGQKRGRIVWAILAAVAVLLLAFFLPPFISINRYKAQITHLVSQSFGRPVRLSAVEARLLPRPGFILYDLSVAEDPAYGAEPVLHANKVTASIRLLTLLTGHIEIDTISVDEASLNLVRAAAGRWNVDPLFRSAARGTGTVAGAGHARRLPYLEATDSRIDFKNGVEKLPFSIVNADLSMWQEDSGEWRIRLRGQPARTDVSLFLEDTGVVRMEAGIKPGAALSESPIHLDLDWRQAQLGQLARLITGSDSGWRGDLTGELHLDGTAEAAQISTRLRASGVHRAEFVPASPLDFDARCNFVYHFTQRNFQSLACDSPVGGGRVHLTAEQPVPDSAPSATVELDHIPVSAGLNVLRTLRSGLQPDLEAAGTVSGKIAYAVTGPAEKPPAAPSAKPAKAPSARQVKSQPVASGPLTGTLTVENLSVTGGGLTRPVQAAKIAFSPAPVIPVSGRSSSAPPQIAITGTFTVPAGGPLPLTFVMRFSSAGYQIGVHGPASIARARELASAAGIPASSALDSLAGEPITVDLVAAGPWIPPEQILLANITPADLPAALPLSPSSPATHVAAPAPGSDTLTGTVTLHNANWRADFLANHLEIADATLHLDSDGPRWDPVMFTYGGLKGSASLVLPQGCSPEEPTLACPDQPEPLFNISFADVDASSVETALLGARQPGTLISTLIERLRPSSAPPWRKAQGTVSAASLVLGPVKLQKVSAKLRILPDGVEIQSFDAGLYGGQVDLSGSLHKPATDQDKPSYSLAGDFEQIDAKSLGQLLGLRWTGSPVSGNGKIDLAGYTDADLGASAAGTLHVEARSGTIASASVSSANASPSGNSPKPDSPPAALNRFDRLTADATISHGVITLGQNEVVSSGRKRSITAIVTFGDPPTVSFEPPKPADSKH